MISLLDRFWPSRTKHKELLRESAEVRDQMLKIAAASRTAASINVIEATDRAAEFPRC